MFNPPGLSQNPDYYTDLLKRITQRVQQKKIDDQILEVVQQAFEIELNRESIIFSRSERVRLFRQVAKTVLTDALGKIGDTK